MAFNQNTKRIAYLTSLYPAMSHTFILREIEALRRLGFDVLPCAIRRPDIGKLPGAPEQKAAAETYYVLAAARKLWPLFAAQGQLFSRPGRYFRTLMLAWQTSAPGMRARLYQLIYFAEATVLARYLRKKNVTHLHNHFADVSANVAMLTAELADIPFSYTLHGPAELFEPQRWHLREKTARAAFVACISHFARSQVMYFADPEHWHKLKIIHCGVEPELYDRPKNSLGNETTRLLFVGRLTAIKGLRVLLEAFAEAQKQHGGLQLTLVGDGDDRAHLERLAAPLGDAVQFTGYQTQEQVAAQLNAADIFVLPSFAEGVPVVLMEAMASTTPVISSLLAGIPELVEDGVSGYLVRPGDAQMLAARIKDLAGNPERRFTMGLAGREKIRAEFNVAPEAARIASLFLEGPGKPIRPVPFVPKEPV